MQETAGRGMQIPALPLFVSPEWVMTWWWKSTTGLALATVSRRQGCPL